MKSIAQTLVRLNKLQLTEIKNVICQEKNIPKMIK